MCSPGSRIFAGANSGMTRAGGMTQDKVRLSKFMSLVLRHRPEHIGLVLDENGWADVGELIERAAAHGVTLTRELIAEIVADQRQAAVRPRPDGRAHPRQSGPLRRYRPGPRARRAAGHPVPRHRRGHRPRHPQRRPEARQPPARAPLPRRGHRRSRSGSGMAGRWCCACLPVRCGHRVPPSIARRMVYG